MYKLTETIQSADSQCQHLLSIPKEKKLNPQKYVDIEK